MAGRRPFALVYDLEVKTQLRAIEPKYRGLIRMTIEEQLRFEPDKEARNRNHCNDRWRSKRRGSSGLVRRTASGCSML